jgi:hypothetical protein
MLAQQHANGCCGEWDDEGEDDEVADQGLLVEWLSG